MEVAIFLMSLKARTLWKTEQEGVGRTVNNQAQTEGQTSNSSKK